MRPYWTTVSQLLHPFSSVQAQHSAGQQKSELQLGRLQRRQERGSQVSPTERMAKLKSANRRANSGNLSAMAITCNVEKVQTMRCFWEMKFEPEVSMQAQICSILSISPKYQKHQQGVVKHSFSHDFLQTKLIHTICCTLTY